MVVTRVGDAWVVIPTGEAAERLRGVVRLNDTAKVVWDGLEEGLDEEEIAARLAGRYDVDESHALESVRRTVDRLAGAGLVEG